MDENKGYRNLEIECRSKDELEEVLRILDYIGMFWYSGDSLKKCNKTPYHTFDGESINNSENVCLLTHYNDRVTWHVKSRFSPDYNRYEHIYADEFIGEYNGEVITPASDISIKNFLYD